LHCVINVNIRVEISVEFQLFSYFLLITVHFKTNRNESSLFYRTYLLRLLTHLSQAERSNARVAVVGKAKSQLTTRNATKSRGTLDGNVRNVIFYILNNSRGRRKAQCRYAVTDITVQCGYNSTEFETC
jgi:hypothetical protein